jgi:hypothetical protein
MKRVHLAFVFTLLVCSFSIAYDQNEPSRTTVQPRDTGVGLANPGMGWLLLHYDNNITEYGLELEPSDTVDDFPGLAGIYMRLAWSYIEPEEGKFNWSIADIPAQRWIAKGKQIAFRFTSAERHEDQPYATPEWVRKAGAKGYSFTPRKGVDPQGKSWEPDYDDPIFLEKLDHFLAAAAARYDGSQHVAFIDVGSFGVYGEGHTDSSTRLPYGAATIRTHIDLYRKHFKHTLLAANDDFCSQGRGLETLTYAQKVGLALRDDSILCDRDDNAYSRAYYHAYLAPMFWPYLPVILESERYGLLMQKGYWADGARYLDAIEDYHASYATVHWYPHEFLAKNRELIRKVNLRLGYRLQLLEASWPAEVKPGEALLVGYSWQNAGVAPCLPGGHPAITLKDEKNGIAGVFVDEEFDMRSLPVGPPGGATPIGREVRPHYQADKPLIAFSLPPRHILKPGLYSIYISVGDSIGTPLIALPLENDDGFRRYRLGSIRIK